MAQVPQGILAVTGKPDLTNPDPGDLALSPEGRMFLRKTLIDIVEQRIRVRLQFFKGEWFLNLEAGTPYFQHILLKGTSDQVIRSVFSQVLRGTEGVKEITSLTWSLNKKTRVLTIKFDLLLEDGTIFKSVNFAPFVIVS